MNRKERRRALIEAIEAIDMPRIRQLAEEDPTIVNAPNSHRNVPLGEATGTGCLEVVKLLVELGADPCHRNHGGLSLLDGCAFGSRVEIARFLISAGAKPNVLHAAALGDIRLMEERIQKDSLDVSAFIDLGRWELTPLHAAVFGGQPEVIERLLELGASVDPENHNEHTPLALVLECSRPERRLEIAERLIEAGANVDTDAGHHGGVLLHRAVMEGDVDLTRLLLRHDADPDRQDWSHKTPLHYAVAKNQTLVKLLLESSPRLDLIAKNGETALDLARRLKIASISRLLEQQESGDEGGA